MPISLPDLLSRLPPEPACDLLPDIRRMIGQSGRKVVVLDDDPTGTQTVAGVTVLTEWSVPSLAAALADDPPVFYILTNSRSLSLDAACSLNREIAVCLIAAARVAGRDFDVVSRSDSTLRGHYPGEVKALAEALGGGFDSTLIVPFFLEGGRYTVDDVHYVASGEVLTPAAETEFARDSVFGYHSSDLRNWVSEKHGGSLLASDVASVSLMTIRLGGPEAVREQLLSLHDGRPCVVNAVSYRDLEVFVLGLLQAEAMGRRFLYRTAASFVRVRSGLPPRSLLSSADLGAAAGPWPGTGGLVIAGSHIGRTSAQIAALQMATSLASTEVSVPRLLDGATRGAEIVSVAARVSEALSSDRHALVYTSRALIAGTSSADNLRIGQSVSEALVDVVRRLDVRPAWMIAKGGITSSDIATQALGIRRATVLGQAIAGVPVWQAGPESRWPGLLYVVFPGNVGGSAALTQMVKMLDAGVAGRACEASEALTGNETELRARGDGGFAQRNG